MRICACGRARAAEVALDEVDGREQLPADAEAPLRFSKEGEKLADVQRGADADAADLRRTLRRELLEVAARGEVVTLRRRELRNLGRLLRLAAESADQELPVACGRDERGARARPQSVLVRLETADESRRARAGRSRCDHA